MNIYIYYLLYIIPFVHFHYLIIQLTKIFFLPHYDIYRMDNNYNSIFIGILIILMLYLYGHSIEGVLSYQNDDIESDSNNNIR